jgi:hypothetical protein
MAVMSVIMLSCLRTEPAQLHVRHTVCSSLQYRALGSTVALDICHVCRRLCFPFLTSFESHVHRLSKYKCN